MSIVFQVDGAIVSPYERISNAVTITHLSAKTKWLLLIFPVTFIIMITGVVWFDWWLTEMSTLFLAAAILVAFVERLNEKKFVAYIISGAQTLLGVAFIVRGGQGVTIILNNGHISDSILFYASRLVSGMPSSLFIVVLLSSTGYSTFLSRPLPERRS